MKKKHIIGLGTLFLVLLLGLFTISYADSTRTWTDIEVKNILYNLYVNVYGANEQTTITNIENNVSKILQYVNDINTRECIIIKNTSGACYFVVCNSDSGPYMTRSNSIAFDRKDSNCYYLLCNNSGLFLDKRTNLNDLDSWSYNDTFYYTSLNIRNFKNAGTYNPSTFFNEWYWTSQLPFSFVPKASNTYADVWTYEDVPFYNASGEDLYIGQLIVPDSVVAELTHYNNFYYRFGTWQFRELPSNSIYLEYVGEQNNSYYFDTYLKKDYFYENTLYNIVWTDYSTEPYTLASANFYIKDINTVITNGVLDILQTFSGDYYQQYEQEQQDIKDIDNISQGVADVVLDDSEVDNILGNFDTSGEIKEYFNYINFNEDTDSIFYEGKNIILYCVNETIESLMRSGDTYIDYQIPGMQTSDRIYSRYFKTPDNGIFFLVKWLLTFGAVYALYANIFATGESLTKLNVWDAMNKNDADIYIYRM